MLLVVRPGAPFIAMPFSTSSDGLQVKTALAPIFFVATSMTRDDKGAELADGYEGHFGTDNTVETKRFLIIQVFVGKLVFCGCGK